QATRPPARWRAVPRGLGGARGPGGRQGRPQPLLAYPPEVVLHAVDQRHRDLLPVILQVTLGLSDIALLPGHAEIGGDPGDDRAGLVAQVAAGAAERGDRGRG